MNSACCGGKFSSCEVKSDTITESSTAINIGECISEIIHTGISHSEILGSATIKLLRDGYI